MSVFTGSRLSRRGRSAGMTSRLLFESKEYRPLFAALGQGVARIPLLPSPSKTRGMARRQGALPGLLRAGVRITPDDGRETSRPTPCGAPTRHLGLYAFDRGRAGSIVPGEAARVRPGDEVASPIARRCRSRSPPTERLRKAPLEEWIGIGSA